MSWLFGNLGRSCPQIDTSPFNDEEIYLLWIQRCHGGTLPSRDLKINKDTKLWIGTTYIFNGVRVTFDTEGKYLYQEKL